MVAAGLSRTITRKTDGTIWAWGDGQLGTADGTMRNTPTQIGNNTDWIAVACGGEYTVGLRTNGTLWSWGRNTFGQLGLGNLTDRNTPTLVGE